MVLPKAARINGVARQISIAAVARNTKWETGQQRSRQSECVRSGLPPIARDAGSANLDRNGAASTRAPATATVHLPRPTARTATHIVVRPPSAHARHFASSIACGALSAAGHGFRPLFGIQNRFHHPRARHDRHPLHHLHYYPRRHRAASTHTPQARLQKREYLIPWPSISHSAQSPHSRRSSEPGPLAATKATAYACLVVSAQPWTCRKTGTDVTEPRWNQYRLPLLARADR